MTGFFIFISCIVIDYRMLKQEKSFIAWIIYISCLGIGVALIVLYSWSFALPSPLNFIIDWLSPVSRWLRK